MITHTITRIVQPNTLASYAGEVWRIIVATLRLACRAIIRTCLKRSRVTYALYCSQRATGGTSNGYRTHTLCVSHCSLGEQYEMQYPNRPTYDRYQGSDNASAKPANYALPHFVTIG